MKTKYTWRTCDIVGYEQIRFWFYKVGVISVKHFAANQKRELSVILDRKRPGGPDDQLYWMSKSQKPISIGLHVIEAP